MAGIAGYTRTHNIGAGVVWVGIQKTDSGMAVTAFRAGDRVGAGRDVSRGRRLASGHSSVVAAAA